jgi:hypothetical protein
MSVGQCIFHLFPAYHTTRLALVFIVISEELNIRTPMPVAARSKASVFVFVFVFSVGPAVTHRMYCSLPRLIVLTQL